MNSHHDAIRARQPIPLVYCSVKISRGTLVKFKTDFLGRTRL